MERPRHPWTVHLDQFLRSQLEGIVNDPADMSHAISDTLASFESSVTAAQDQSVLGQNESPPVLSPIVSTAERRADLSVYTQAQWLNLTFILFTVIGPPMSMSVYKTCCEHCNDVGQSKTAFIEAMLSVDESTCNRIGKIVNESSYRVAESSQSFTESSCLVAESSCHRIGQLTNCPVSL